MPALLNAERRGRQAGKRARLACGHSRRGQDHVRCRGADRALKHCIARRRSVRVHAEVARRTSRCSIDTGNSRCRENTARRGAELRGVASELDKQRTAVNRAAVGRSRAAEQFDNSVNARLRCEVGHCVGAVRDGVLNSHFVIPCKLSV